MDHKPETTASLGKLVVDERNGYIGISKTEKGKEPIQWFKITDIENPGLYCVKPRIGWGNKVAVGCEFICDIPSQGRHIKEVVKQRIYCKHRTYTKNARYEEWDEPGTISIMRSIIESTYETAIKEELRPLAASIRFVKDSIHEQALCVFMLTNEYSEQELTARYDKLQAAFGDSAENLWLLGKYYHDLKQNLCKCEEAK